MNNNSRINHTGVTFSGLLAIVFITLKLCKVINWSWWWVLSPIWIPVVLVVLIIVVIFVLESVKEIIKKDD